MQLICYRIVCKPHPLNDGESIDLNPRGLPRVYFDGWKRYIDAEDSTVYVLAQDVAAAAKMMENADVLSIERVGVGYAGQKPESYKGASQPTPEIMR